jgi:hypothetical protein
MPEYMKQQVMNRRTGHLSSESGNNAMSLGPSGMPLTIPAIISTTRNGLPYMSSKTSSVIYEGNKIVGSLHFHGNQVYSDVHSPTSSATAHLASFSHDADLIFGMEDMGVDT